MNYLELGTEPVSDENPAGTDVRYEEAFEALQAEIDKLASPTERDAFSWEEVTTLAAGILQEKSKDILVASYLCVGLLHLNGSEGFDQATRIYDDLITNFWDDLFPLKKRMRGREAAISWWIEKTEAALENGVTIQLEKDSHEAVLERLGRIDELMESEEAIDLSLLPLIGRVRQAGPVAEKNEVPDAAVAEQTTTQVAPPVSQDIEIACAEDAIKKTGPLFQKIRQAAKYIREEKTKDPRAYRWLRFALWEPVLTPPVATDGKTKVPPPSQQLLANMELFRENEEWESLLFASESALNNPKNMFLLDLNRLSAEALSGLGKQYSTARNVVCQETLAFVRRLSGLEEMTFSDGTPFAQESTKDWLRSIDAETDSSSGPEAGGFVGEEMVAETIQEARNKAKEEGLKEGVRFLQQSINAVSSEREAARLRMGLIRILRAEKQDKSALPHIEILFDSVRKHQLDLWEPELAVTALKTVYTVFKSQKDQRYVQKAEEAFSLIAGIDATEVLVL